MLVTATNGGKVKGIIKLLAPSYIVLATVMSDFPQWGVSGEDGQYHNWIIPYSTCFFAKSEYRNPREADWNLITEYDQLKFKVWFTNDTVFKYPNIKCSVFSFGVSA